MHKLLRPTAPTCLNNFNHGQNNWGDVSSADKDDIWRQLNQMQQHRCAYCECNIEGDQKAHIEHFRQRSSYPQGTFDWNNLFGSCNQNESCGKHKDRCGPYKPTDLIKMDNEDPEKFFLFVSDGTIAFRSDLSESEQTRAKETLRIFNLDAKHGRLRQMRKSAAKNYIHTAEFLLQEMIDVCNDSELMPLFEEELKKELETINNLPFATAIKHVFESKLSH